MGIDLIPILITTFIIYTQLKIFYIMKIIYDIECYPNVFLLSYKDYSTKEVVVYEISEYRNDLDELISFFTSFNKFLISFNGIHYDGPMLLYLLHNGKRILNEEGIDSLNRKLKDWSDYIINNDFWWHEDDLKKYKYQNQWIDIDLFLYWSKMLRLSKKISLKSLAIQLNYPVVQELPFDPSMSLNADQIEELIHYNSVHDLNITELLLTTMEKQVKQRNDAIKKFQFDKTCYSWDGVKLGLNILLKEYCIENNKTFKEIKDLRTPFPTEGIEVKNILLPQISFIETPYDCKKTKEEDVIVYNFNSFHSLFTYLKTKTVFTTKDINCSVLYKGVKYDIKSGGLHSWHKNDIVAPDLSKVIYRDIDVSSYYPTLGSEYEFVPRHLPGMGKVIKRLKTQRIIYKKEGNSKDAELYKLALNGGYYGNLNNSYSPMEDPLQLLSVTLNGQLFLLMLCEWLDQEGITIDMVNTDGITAIIPIEKESIFKELYHKWEVLTKMELEEVDYSKVVRKNINNYLAVYTNGKIKAKGLFKFDDEVPLGDNVDFFIIPKALRAYFIDQTPVKDFVLNHKEIYDFCCSVKVGKQYFVQWTNPKGITTKQQRLNRFYASTKGGYIIKVKEKSEQHILKDSGVMLYNEHLFEFPTDINYSFYIKKINEIIDELNNNGQLDLFS